MDSPDPKRPWEHHYSAQRVVVVVEAQNMRVLDAILAVGELVPWHYHSNIDDHFWVIEGKLRIESQSPDKMQELSAGDYCSIPAGCPHQVVNAGGGNCRFINLQGVGSYDYIPAGGSSHTRLTEGGGNGET